MLQRVYKISTRYWLISTLIVMVLLTILCVIIGGIPGFPHFAEVIASLAPRSVFVSAPAQDPIMGVEGVKSAVAGATAIYQLRKAGTALRAVHPSGGRDFTEAARGEAYAWLDQRFKR